MIIGFDAKRAFLNLSGLGNYSRSTILLLNEFFPQNNYYLYSPYIDKSLESFTFGEGIDNLHLKLPKNAKDTLFSAHWRTFKLGKVAAKDKVDIFHGLSNELPKDILKSKIKSFVTIHDLIFIRYPELYKPIDRVIYKNKSLFACKAAHKVIAVSEQTKLDIVEFLNISPDKIEVVYQGCNPLYYNTASDEMKQKVRELFNLPPNYMLTVGTIEERKNLLSVVKAIHAKPTGIPLIAIGSPSDYMFEIKKYIITHKLEKDVIILNNVATKFLPAIYQMSSLFLYPSIFEGFGIPILEALNSNVPVITTRGGCFSESGGLYSSYVNPLDIEDISNAMHTVLNDSELRAKMIAEGLNHAQKFKEQNVANRLMEVYMK